MSGRGWLWLRDAPAAALLWGGCPVAALSAHRACGRRVQPIVLPGQRIRPIMSARLRFEARTGTFGRALGKPVRPEWPGGFASLYQMETIPLDGQVASGTVAKGSARSVGALTQQAKLALP